MSDKDRANLLAILDSVDKIKRYISESKDAVSLYEDELRYDAVLMNFINIGEAVSRLPMIITEEIELPWNQIRGFRNLIAHIYFGVDAEELWQTINENLPPLKQEIKNFLEK